MKTKLEYPILIAILFSMVLFSQCRKSDRNNEVVNPAPQENAMANIFFNDLFRLIHEVSTGDTLINGTSSMGNSKDACIDNLFYSSVQETFPNTMVVDFGDDQTNCSLDGRIRNGKLRLDYSGRYGDSLSVVNVEFIGYYVDSLKLSATMTITNRGRNTNLEPIFKVAISNGLVERDTINFNWNSNKTYTWTAGSTTVSTSDDSFEISGDSDGTTSKGNSYDADIIESLVTNYSCNWFSAGTEKVSPNNLTDRDVDYGTSCSASVSVKYYNTEYDFSLE